MRETSQHINSLKEVAISEHRARSLSVGGCVCHSVSLEYLLGSPEDHTVLVAVCVILYL